MTHLLSRRWTIVLFILCNLLAIIACQPGAAVGTPAATPAVGDQATPEGPLTVEVVFGPGSLNLTEPAAGLSDLSGYKATLILSFDGTQAGQSQQWSRTYVMLASQEPAARRLTIEKAGDISDPNQVFMAEVDGAAYERRGENACTASVIQEGSSLAERWEPAGFLTGVIGAEEAGSETVNGVAASHYTFDERAFGQLGVAKSTGEIWVASDGGYIVRYRVATEGNADYFGEDTEGTITWDYELTDVNQPVTFELPEDCPAGMVNAPLLPDAAVVVNMPGVLTYDTSSSLAEAGAFYQKQIPDLGWELLGEPSISDSMVLLDYTQGDKTMTVIITTGDAGTKVHIVLGRSQE
ncbi:MAG: hypothetical protein WC832_07015 [Anaerolineales bacterium]